MEVQCLYILNYVEGYSIMYQILCTTVCTKYIYSNVSQNVRYREIIIFEDYLGVLTKTYGVPIYMIIMVYVCAIITLFITSIVLNSLEPSSKGTKVQKS